MRPNIIFYFSDQQRWDTLGCYGQPLNVTPNLDNLAKEGTQFMSAYTCQPVCGPARACLQTGKYATEVHCCFNGRRLPDNVKTLGQLFSENGYETAYIGKWHLASDMPTGENYVETAVPENRRGGYQYWMASDVLESTSHGYNGYVFDKNGKKHEFIGYRADCINNYAIDYLHQRDKDKPFFMFVSQIEPHHQNDHDRFEGPDGSKEKFKNFIPPKDLEGHDGDWKQNYPDYLGQCHSLDENVGRLITTLKEEGVWENTILIYASDHGSHFYTRNYEYKRSCHESASHIPMIFHGPYFNGGKKIENLVSLLDIPKTLLDCAGIEIPEDFQRYSLKKLVEGKYPDWEDVIFMQISESQVGRAIRTKQYKYSVRAVGDMWLDEGGDTYYEQYLYDVVSDPYEQENLVENPEYEDVRKTLSEILKREMVKAGEKEPEILPSHLFPEE